MQISIKYEKNADAYRVPKWEIWIDGNVVAFCYNKEQANFIKKAIKVRQDD